MRNFLLLWITQAFSGLGSGMTSYALVIWSYTEKGSALATSMLMICSYAPYVLLSIFAGALSDKWNKKATMLVCDTAAAYLKNPDCDLLETLPAPDFPTGGELICDRDALRDIYATGRGGVKVRAKWRYVKEENLIEITEIPYSTSTEAILDKVAELIKAGKAKEIADMRDETDLSGLKLTIDLKRGADPDKLMARLFKQTPLEDAFSCNLCIKAYTKNR